MSSHNKLQSKNHFQNCCVDDTSTSEHDVVFHLLFHILLILFFFFELINVGSFPFADLRLTLHFVFIFRVRWTIFTIWSMIYMRSSSITERYSRFLFCVFPTRFFRSFASLLLLSCIIIHRTKFERSAYLWLLNRIADAIQWLIQIMFETKCVECNRSTVNSDKEKSLASQYDKYSGTHNKPGMHINQKMPRNSKRTLCVCVCNA